MINLLRIVVWVDFQNMLFPMVLKKFLLRLGQSLAGKKKKKKGHEFEREQKGVYGKIWREERKGRNVVTIL